jgi:acetyl-CoA acyltransferase
MPEAVIIDAIRTPIGALGGSLAKVRPDDLAALVMKTILERNHIDPASIEEVIFGCANQAGEDNRNVARMALLLAGIPVSVPGVTVNRLCASGLAAVNMAARAIRNGDGDIYLAGGVESMSRAPYSLPKAEEGFAFGNLTAYDTALGWRYPNPKVKELYGTEAMGETAENLADMYGISREDQDRFALWSQQKAADAQQSGRLAEEIAPVLIPQKKKDPLAVSHDEFLKPDTTLEVLASLRPAFRKEGGSVTAGNASGLNDGAAALLIASDVGVEKYGLKPLSRIVSSAVVGVEPRIMGIGPVGASQKALAKAGLRLEDMDLIEINEAFAVQALACTRALGLADDDPRINPNGGAIAIGHPLGMTGARILLSASLELKKRQARFALVTMCIGVGQGYAVILEKPL